jgi:hypothetical protein
MDRVETNPEEAKQSIEQNAAATKAAEDAPPVEAKTTGEAPKDLKVPDAPKPPAVPENVEISADQFAKYSQELTAGGKLSDSSYAELEKQGIPKNIVDSYVQGQMALVQQAQQEVFTAVGGADSYKAMVDWAASNLGPDEVTAYNAAVESGNKNQIMFAVKGLQARFAAQSEPRLVTGDGGKVARGFRSSAEVIEAMKDPKYKSDPAYRADVERRMAVSNF